MSIDDRIREAMRALDASTELADADTSSQRLDEDYRARLADAGSAVALHRQAMGVETYLRAEAAARAGLAAEAEALYAIAAAHGIGDDTNCAVTTDTERDPLAATVASAQAGDRVAVERVVQQIRPFVEAICGASTILAAHVAPAICRVVVAALPAYDGSVPFLEFVHATTVRILAARPGQSRGRRAEHDHLEEVAAALDRIPRQQRDVLVLRIVLGMSLDQVAEALGSTPGAMRVAQHKALARLRDQTTGPGTRVAEALTAPLLRDVSTTGRL